MELKTVKYNAKEMKPRSKVRKQFKNQTSDINIIYFFYKETNCLYIGQTDVSLYNRCYVNTPKESKQPWFTEANLIHIIKLDENIDDIARQALESSFIMAYRPKYNKKC